MSTIPTFNSSDEFCICLQGSLRDELMELVFLMPRGKARTVVADRIRELEKQIAMLKAKVGAQP